MTNNKGSVYAWLGQQALAVFITSALTYVAIVARLDARVTALENQTKEARADLKDIAKSVNSMAVGFAELSTVVKENIKHGNQRTER